jgi:hypothetical protein
LPSAFLWHSAKYIYLFFFFALKLFLLWCYIIFNYICKFGSLLELFAVFSQLILFDWISCDNWNMNCKSWEEWKKMNGKMIFLLLSLLWHLIHERTWKLQTSWSRSMTTNLCSNYFLIV